MSPHLSQLPPVSRSPNNCSPDDCSPNSPPTTTPQTTTPPEEYSPDSPPSGLGLTTLSAIGRRLQRSGLNAKARAHPLSIGYWLYLLWIGKARSGASSIIPSLYPSTSLLCRLSILNPHVPKELPGLDAKVDERSLLCKVFPPAGPSSP